MVTPITNFRKGKEKNEGEQLLALLWCGSIRSTRADKTATSLATGKKTSAAVSGNQKLEADPYAHEWMPCEKWSHSVAVPGLRSCVAARA